MAFAHDIRRWPTLAAFEAHLAAHNPAIAPWADGVTLHHTWTPTLAQWRGLRSVEGARDYYIDLGWDAGPHLFVALGSPRPEWDGIFQLTPLNTPGIHAGACNTHYWGMEIVGRYDDAPWPAPLADLVYGVTCALLRWRDLGPKVTGHRECLPNKSCPGRAINMPMVRDEVRYRLNRPAPGTTAPLGQPLSEDSRIISPPRATLEQAAFSILSFPHGSYSQYDIVTNILPAYWRACEAVGVDPLVAVSQMIHETGNLTSALSQRKDKDGRNLRNPAGIGVYEARAQATKTYRPGCVWDADVQGYRPSCQFASWGEDAIPAHVGRLVAYALPSVAWNPAQQALVAKALEYRALPSKCWGSAPTLKLLGAAPNAVDDCGWASPGHDYGQRLAAIANRIRGR